MIIKSRMCKKMDLVKHINDADALTFIEKTSKMVWV